MPFIIIPHVTVPGLMEIVKSTTATFQVKDGSKKSIKFRYLFDYQNSYFLELLKELLEFKTKHSVIAVLVK